MPFDDIATDMFNAQLFTPRDFGASHIPNVPWRDALLVYQDPYEENLHNALYHYPTIGFNTGGYAVFDIETGWNVFDENGERVGRYANTSDDGADIPADSRNSAYGSTTGDGGFVWFWNNTV